MMLIRWLLSARRRSYHSFIKLLHLSQKNKEHFFSNHLLTLMTNNFLKSPSPWEFCYSIRLSWNVLKTLKSLSSKDWCLSVPQCYFPSVTFTLHSALTLTSWAFVTPNLSFITMINPISPPSPTRSQICFWPPTLSNWTRVLLELRNNMRS